MEPERKEQERWLRNEMASLPKQIKKYVICWKWVFSGSNTSVATALLMLHLFLKQLSTTLLRRLFLPLVSLHHFSQILALPQLPDTFLQIISFWERRFLVIQSEKKSQPFLSYSMLLPPLYFLFKSILLMDVLIYLTPTFTSGIKLCGQRDLFFMNY